MWKSTFFEKIARGKEILLRLTENHKMSSGNQGVFFRIWSHIFNIRDCDPKISKFLNLAKISVYKADWKSDLNQEPEIKNFIHKVY